MAPVRRRDPDSDDDSDVSNSDDDYGEEYDGPKHRKVTRGDERRTKELSMRTPTLDSIAKVCREKLKELEAIVHLRPEKSGKTFKKGKVMTRIERKRKRLIKGHIRRLKARLKKKGRYEELRAIREEEKKIIKMIPRTLDNTREEDVTIINKDEPDEEMQKEEDIGAYARYYKKRYEPKLLISTTYRAHKKTAQLVRDLRRIIPNAITKARNKASIQKTIKQASRRGYTDMLIVNENRNKPNGLLLIHLPRGPTVQFRITKYTPGVEVDKNYAHRKRDRFKPETFVSNFSTRLGDIVGRMLGALFNQDPDYRGRRVVTFHNQRDHIFLRHHRYEFKSGKKVALKELGPRISLQLTYLQQDAFKGDFEWMLKRHEMETSRRRFFL